MGCGVVASYGHGPAIRDVPGLEFASAYDPNPEQLARYLQQYPQVQGFTDADAFFRSGVDGVAITSPAPRHLENVRMAAEYGVPVLCEKPLAMNDAEILEMIGIMEKANLPLATALCYRFSPVALKIKELVENRVIGDVRALRLVYIWNLHGRWEYDSQGNRIVSPRRVGRMLEGGPMVDCGVHQIDLALWWLGSDLVYQQAAGAWIDNDFDAPEHIWLHMDHENGAHTMVEMSFSYAHTVKEPVDRFTYELIGTGGLIRYDRDGWRFEVRNEHGTFWLPGASEKNFYGMYEAFRDLLETGEMGNLPSARDGLRITRIARTATEDAMVRHQRMRLEQTGSTAETVK
ncbi:MAG: Gfo/Idh/MocA family oxidoreductase [Armatimonadaceae bacterium]